MMYVLAFVLLNFVGLSCSVVLTTTEQKHPLQRKVTLENHADMTIDIAWVNPSTGSSESIASSIHAGDIVVLDTFVNHTFVVQPSPIDVESTDDVSPAKSSVPQRVPTNNLVDDDIDETSMEHGISYLTVSSEDPEQVIIIQQGLLLERSLAFEDSNDEIAAVSSPPSTMKKEKNPTVEAMIESCRQQYPNDVTELVQCIETKTAETFIELNEELAFQRDLRRTMANMNENYTCTDITRPTTTPKRTTTWSYSDGPNHAPIIRTVGILHEHRASQIHAIENFISEEECLAIQAMAEPLLHRGTVADGKGGSTMSPNRKAWQAGIAVDDYYNTNDPIANVKRRLFAYTNHAVPYNLTLDGQEELMSIQYFGLHSTAPRATSDNEHSIRTTPDRYTPHCDGDCNDMIHKTGSRIATMVMYCTIPEESGGVGGGGTNFQQANVYVQPKVGSSVFFSYMDPITLIHDEGYTTHSGCPVVYGTKRIVVQWMRYGVDHENTWDSFDTNNIKIENSN